MLADVFEGEQVAVHDQGDADAGGEDGVEQVVGDLADAAVEEFDQIMASVEAGEEVVLHEQAVAQAVLLAEDDGFGGHLLLCWLFGGA